MNTMTMANETVDLAHTPGFLLVMLVCFALNVAAGFMNHEADNSIMINWLRNRKQYRQGQYFAVAAIILVLSSHPALYFTYGYHDAIAAQVVPEEWIYAAPALICFVQLMIIARATELHLIAQCQLEYSNTLSNEHEDV